MSSRSSPLRLEFGPGAGTDPDLTQLAVGVDLGGTGPLQSDIHGEPNGELLSGDVPFRLQGSEPVEFGDRRRVEFTGLFSRHGGLAFQRDRLLGVFTACVERLDGYPCRVQSREVAGAVTLDLEVFDFVAVTVRDLLRLAQEVSLFLEGRLPFTDVGRERRYFVTELGEFLSPRDLAFEFLLAMFQLQAPVLRFLLAQPPLLLAGAGFEPVHLFSSGPDLGLKSFGRRLGFAPAHS